MYLESTMLGGTGIGRGMKEFCVCAVQRSYGPFFATFLIGVTSLLETGGSSSPELF